MMEHINTESTYYVNLHYGGGKRINYRSCQQARGDLLNTPDPAGWHTFGTLWDSSYIRFFLDGVKVRIRLPSAIFYSRAVAHTSEQSFILASSPYLCFACPCCARRLSARLLVCRRPAVQYDGCWTPVSPPLHPCLTTLSLEARH